MTMLKAISHIALVVRDATRTARLFEQVFGARAVMREHERKGPPETFLSMGGTCFVLVEGAPPASRSDDHIAFAVSGNDLKFFAEKLRGFGIESQTARAGTAAESLYFFDYDNHLFELHTGRPAVPPDLLQAAPGR